MRFSGVKPEFAGTQELPHNAKTTDGDQRQLLARPWTI